MTTKQSHRPPSPLLSVALALVLVVVVLATTVIVAAFTHSPRDWTIGMVTATSVFATSVCADAWRRRRFRETSP